MTTFDQFAVTDGSVTADPADGSAPVTFDAALVDRHDDGTAGWEPLVADWLDAGDGSISFDADGSAALSSDRVLSATEASSAVAVGDRRGAEAVLAYLAHEGVVGVDDDSVTVLRPFEEVAETHTAVYNNWAATVDVLVDRVDVLVDRLEGVKTAVRERDLPIAVASPDADALARTVRRLSAMRDVLAERRDDFRRLAISSTIFPEPLVETGDRLPTFVEASLGGLPTPTELATTADRTVAEDAERAADQCADFLSSLSSACSPAEKLEEESLDDFLDDITDSDEAIDDVGGSVDSADDTTDDPSDAN